MNIITGTTRHYSISFLVVLLACSLGFLGCKDKALSAQSLANALADEFTEGLEFEDQTILAGPPPASTLGNPQFYAIEDPVAIAPVALGIPDSVDYGEPFDLVLRAQQVIDDGSVVGVIAHVEQSNVEDSAANYFQVDPPAAAFVGDQVTLRATYHYGQNIEGNAFRVRLAFLMATGDVSIYRDWNIVTYPQPGQTTLTPMCDCEAVTPEDPVSGYNILESTNLDLNPACGTGGHRDEDNILNYYYGNTETSYDSDPCNQYRYMYGTRSFIEDFVFPDNTKWRPYFDDLGNVEICTLEIGCE